MAVILYRGTPWQKTVLPRMDTTPTNTLNLALQKDADKVAKTIDEKGEYIKNKGFDETYK